MQSLKSLLIGGAAIAGLAVLAPAVARELNTHHMTVPVPGGGVATIEYSGNVAPKISFRPIAGSQLVDPFAWSATFGLPSFAALDRMTADMDRQMNVMMHRAEMLSRLPQDGGLRSAVTHDLPPGTSFSMVSETTSNGVCTHVTRITQAAGDAKPQVVSNTSGNCGERPSAALPIGNDPNLKRINGDMPVAPAPRSTL
jgi:hypothetical protein